MRNKLLFLILGLMVFTSNAYARDRYIVQSETGQIKVHTTGPGDKEIVTGITTDVVLSARWYYTGTLGIPHSATKPTPCTPGDIYLDTAQSTGLQFYACESSGTWARQGDGSGSGGSPGGAGANIQYNNGGVFGGVTGWTASSSTITVASAAILSVSDGGLIDLSGVNASATTEGIKMPQTTSCSSATAEGQLCWETDRDLLWMGNGTAAQLIAGDISARAYANGTQSTGTGEEHRVSLLAETSPLGYDTDNMHYTSNSNLTGTVSKTVTSPNVTGSGTAFTSELSTGQVICIPDSAGSCATNATTNDFCTITTVTDNTNLVCAQDMASSASGVTARRDSSFFVARTAGKYLMVGIVKWASDVTRYCMLQGHYADGTSDNIVQTFPGGTAKNCVAQTVLHLEQWDSVVIIGAQTTGTVNMTGDENVNFAAQLMN